MVASWLRHVKKRFVGQSRLTPLRRLSLETLETREVPASIWTGGDVPDIPIFNSSGTIVGYRPNDPRWSNPNNWTGDGVPTNNSDVVFPDFAEPGGPPCSSSASA